jgi:hypothetical protein
MNRMTFSRVAGWGIGLAAATGLQLWWWAGDGPGWLPVLTGPALVAATLGINGAFMLRVPPEAGRRRLDPELAAQEALRREAGELPALSSGGLFGAR